MKLTGNTVLITGGTSGIGRALAEAFHALGNQVIIAGRRQQLLDEVVQKNPGMAALEVDVENAASIDHMVAQIKAKFPKLNVLINNAGIMRQENYAEGSGDPAAAAATISTNISSVIHLSTALLPLLKQQPAATLIATTSGLAFVPSAYFPTYSASKAFVHSWLTSLRFQLRNSNVEVLELTPPYVQTELTGSAQAKDPNAMPLAEFIAESLEIIGSGRTHNGEILVERVKPLRWAEKNDKLNFLLEALGKPR